MPDPKNSPEKAPETPPSGALAKPKNGGGGKIGNLNALVTGANLRRLVVGELPPQMKGVSKEALKYRVQLEAEVVKEKGEISYTDAHRIDTATAATIHAGVCRWILRKKIETMTAAEILNCTSNFYKAKERRDSAVASLGLDNPPESPYTIVQ